MLSFSGSTVWLAAGVYNLSALSGDVAYEKLGAIFSRLLHPQLHPRLLVTIFEKNLGIMGAHKLILAYGSGIPSLLTR